jgi:hypothetical protein
VNLLRLLGVRTAVAVDAVSKTFRGERGPLEQRDADAGLVGIAPMLDHGRTESHARMHDERVAQAKQYLRTRDNYFKKRVGARVIDEKSGKPDAAATLAERMVLRAEFDKIPDLVQSEQESREVAAGLRVFPHRSTDDAKAYDRELNPEGPEWWRGGDAPEMPKC